MCYVGGGGGKVVDFGDVVVIYVGDFLVGQQCLCWFIEILFDE